MSGYFGVWVTTYSVWVQFTMLNRMKGMRFYIVLQLRTSIIFNICKWIMIMCVLFFSSFSVPSRALAQNSWKWSRNTSKESHVRNMIFQPLCLHKHKESRSARFESHCVQFSWIPLLLGESEISFKHNFMNVFLWLSLSIRFKASNEGLFVMLYVIGVLIIAVTFFLQISLRRRTSSGFSCASRQSMIKQKQAVWWTQQVKLSAALPNKGKLSHTNMKKLGLKIDACDSIWLLLFANVRIRIWVKMFG